MSTKFYKDANGQFRKDGALVVGSFRMVIDTDDIATATKAGISSSDCYHELIPLTDIANITLENGTPYASVAAFDTAVRDFFVKASSSGGAELTSDAEFLAGITTDKAPTAKQSFDKSVAAEANAKSYADGLVITAGSMDAAIYVPKIEANEKAITLISPRIKSMNLYDKSKDFKDISFNDQSEEVVEIGASVSDHINIDDLGDYEFIGFQSDVWHYTYYYADDKTTVVGRSQLFKSTLQTVPVALVIPQGLGIKTCRFETKGSGVGAEMTPDTIYFREVPKYLVSQVDLTYQAYEEVVDLSGDITLKENDLSLVTDDTITFVNPGNIALSHMLFETATIGGETIHLYERNVLLTSADSVFEYDVSDVLITSYPHNTLNLRHTKLDLNANTKKLIVKVQLVDLHLNYSNLTQIRNDFSVVISNQKAKELRPLYEIAGIGGDPILTNREYDHLYNIIVAFFGDSIAAFGNITADGSFVYKLDNLDILSVHNYAKGSARFCDNAGTTPEIPTVETDGSFTYVGADNNVVSNQIRLMVSLGVVPDVVILTGTTNDAHDADKTIGDIETAVASYVDPSLLDKTEFYNMCVWAVRQLRDVNPNVEIIFASPIRPIRIAPVEIIPNVKAYADAFGVVSNRFGTPFMDFYNCGVIDFPLVVVDNPYFYDDLHPSEFGITEMFNYAWNFIIDNVNK